MTNEEYELLQTKCRKADALQATIKCCEIRRSDIITCSALRICDLDGSPMLEVLLKKSSTSDGDWVSIPMDAKVLYDARKVLANSLIPTIERATNDFDKL